MTLGSLHIERIELSEMSPALYNPRTIDKKSQEGLSNSIDEFGLVEPIIYNKQTGNIVGGHQRYQLLKNKDVSFTDAVVVNLSLEKEKALNVALNHHGITGKYDEEKLQNLLGEIDTDLLQDLNLDQLQSETADINVLDEFDLEDELGEMEKNVKTSLTIQFTSDQIEEAKHLIEVLTKRQTHVGTVVLRGLREYVKE